MTIENLAAGGTGEPAAGRPATFRYGVVFLLTGAPVVFVIAAPSANWSRAVALVIEGVAFVVAIATRRARKELRYRRPLGVGVAIVFVVAGVWIGIISRQLIAVADLLVTAGVPAAIVGGSCGGCANGASPSTRSPAASTAGGGSGTQSTPPRSPRPSWLSDS